MPEGFTAELRARSLAYHRERRSVLLVTLACAWVFGLAFGTLGCAEGLRDRLLFLGDPRLVRAAAVWAHLLLAGAVLGPLAYLRGSALPRAWGLEAGRGGWVRGFLGRLAVLGGLWTLLFWDLDRAPAPLLALAAWIPGILWNRRGPRLVRYALLSGAAAAVLGVVGEGLLRHAALHGTWGVSGAGDPAAWPLLAVVGSVVALPLLPLLLAERRRAFLEADAEPVGALRLRGERLEGEIEAPRWALRWTCARPTLAERLERAQAREGVR